MNLWNRFSVAASVLVLSSCSNPTAETLIAQASSAFQQYTGYAPGTTQVTGSITTPPLAATYADDVNSLQVLLAQEIASLQSQTVSLDTLNQIEALNNALQMVAIINTALQNPPPSLPSTPNATTSAFLSALTAAERSQYEIIGEQAVVGLAIPTTTSTVPDPAALASINDELLYEANKARADGYAVRADLIRIDAVTLGDYAQEQGTASSEQIVPIPAATTEVPEVFSDVGIFESVAQALRHQRKTIDTNDIYLPATCDDVDLSEDACPIQPIVVLPASVPVPTLTAITGFPTGFPTDLATAANAVIADVNAGVQEFIDTPQGGPVNSTLGPEMGTLEVEAAQLLAYFYLIDDTPVARQFIASIQAAQTLIVVLATMLSVPAPTDPSAINTPDLANLNLTQIPATPNSTQPTGLFLDTRINPITVEDALTEGALLAEKALYEIVGENILTLHYFTSATTPAPAPTAAQITEILQNYENTAINADNNGEPSRAALLRMIEAGFRLTTATPAALPVPEATPVILNTLSQAGYPASIAQNVNLRRRAIDVNDASVPAECDDTTWDSATCPLVPN